MGLTLVLKIANPEDNAGQKIIFICQICCSFNSFVKNGVEDGFVHCEVQYRIKHRLCY